MTARAIGSGSCRAVLTREWQTVAEVAARLGVSEASARRRLAMLRAAGAAQRVTRGGERWRVAR